MGLLLAAGEAFLLSAGATPFVASDATTSGGGRLRPSPSQGTSCACWADDLGVFCEAAFPLRRRVP
jgi:hypothetical protein